jgi:hypothetical protein
MTIIIIPPVNRCIYEALSEKHDGPFSDEHVVPLGLGGDIIIRKASCRNCAKITGRFEQTVLRMMMGALRIRLGLPTRRPKERPDTLTLMEFDRNGRLQSMTLPALLAPAVIPGLLVPAPGVFRNVPPTNTLDARVRSLILEPDKLRKLIPDGHRLRINRVHPGHFLRMIAKIAHCYAFATWGNQFTPLLLDLILGRADYFNYLMGGDAEIPPPDHHPQGLHMHQPVSISFNGVRYLVVIVRLFTARATPRYHVVVGEAHPGLTQEIEKAIGHTGEKIPYVVRSTEAQRASAGETVIRRFVVNEHG